MAQQKATAATAAGTVTADTWENFFEAGHVHSPQDDEKKEKAALEPIPSAGTGT